MKGKEENTLKFGRTNSEFTRTLNQRVHEYFKTRGINKHGNWEMATKTMVMFLLYLGPYFLIITSLVTSTWALILCGIVMAAGLSGIGLSVMHDANHGAYSGKKWVNKLLGYSLNLVGANKFNWKIQHNLLHHSYTNVHDEDEDISPRGAIRMSPHAEWRRIHRYQHIYAWSMYGLMTIFWIFAKDFIRIVKYTKDGLVAKQKGHLFREWVILIATKLFFVGYIFVIPLLATEMVWWEVMIGVLGVMYLSGFFLAIVFQPAHVAEETEFPVPDDKNQLEDAWAVHQLRTTANFGNSSRWFSWFVGGLNFQIEHHLFPHVCHVHYRKISKIVRKTAQEFDLPYNSSKTFIGALYSHFKFLRELGMNPARANN